MPDITGPPTDGDDLRAKTLRLLDFPAVRLRLAEHTHFFPARQLALELTPSYQAEEVEVLQRETAEGRTLLDEAGDVGLHTTADASAAVARAALDGLLTGQQLLEVSDSLEVQLRARSAVLRAGPDVPVLALMAEQIPDLRELTRQINTRIGTRGEVLDSATPSLRAIRTQVRQAYESATQALTRIIQSQVGQEALQDQVISVRAERLVVQVKAEMRHRIPGVVHDASNTGATLFIEPFATVELCNAWRELVLEEEREVMRVLRDLSTLVGALAGDIRRGDDMVARLDLVLARARYSRAIDGASALSPLADVAVHLLNARHPLLGDGAVPINVNVGPEWSVLVITGPNTGGKTVAMKTLGLLALMHQSGLQVPADRGSSLPVFDGVYADVGDQQSIEQSVSTFSSHMRNVIDILGEAGPSSLVLLDELGTSTDPEEGSALAKAVLDRLATDRVPTIATTHYRAVAAYAEASPGMMNASVQLEPTTLKPTYHLTVGIPGRSYAMSVASQLGLPDDVMEKARSLMEPQYLRFEDWLKELQSERSQLHERLEEAERARAEAESIRGDLESQLASLASEREDIRDSMRRELYAQYEEVRRKLRRAEAELSWTAPPAESTEIRADVEEIKRQLEAAFVPDEVPVVRPDTSPVETGDLVSIRGLSLQGTVASLAEDGRTAEVSIGKVRLQIELHRLSRIDGEPEDGPSGVHVRLGPLLSSTELDLRGLRADEALMRLEDFLDKAVRDGLGTVRVIHGRGTGALRQAVREHLERHPLALSYGPEVREHGGNGATFVELA